MVRTPLSWHAEAVSYDKLTRQELGWLLTQEARGTAQALREGVTQLKTYQASGTEQAPHVDSMLDALDGAIEMLGALENSPHAGKDRRGRIDIAALLFELAPEARIALEPGAGTEVMGVESELRRMLSVLVRQPGTVGSQVPSGLSIRREGDWIRITVESGPEGAPRRDLEYRWLSRMAVRQGGRVELQRGNQSLLLPAEQASDQREIESLRRELEQAQLLGAACARELAEALTTSETGMSVSTIPSPPRASQFDTIAAMATVLGQVLRPIVQGLRADFLPIDLAVGDSAGFAPDLSSHLAAIQALLAEIDRIAQCSSGQSAENVDVVVLLRSVVGQAVSDADRLGVRIEVLADGAATAYVQSCVLELLLRCLLKQAIAVTPPGQLVSCRARMDDMYCEICVEDGGPVLSAADLDALLSVRGAPQAVGRCAGLVWLVVGAAADKVSAHLQVGTSKSGNAQVRVILPGTR
jgi:two-component system OmpR family sensor kinase